jgi:hypothetical protein
MHAKRHVPAYIILLEGFSLQARGRKMLAMNKQLSRILYREDDIPTVLPSSSSLHISIYTGRRNHWLPLLTSSTSETPETSETPQ